MIRGTHAAARGVWLAWGTLAGYWLALFVATHIPSRMLPQPRISDKLVHVVAFAGLGLLLCCAWSRTRPWRPARAWIVLTLLAAYAAADELLQIPVGRHGDVADWIADVIGVAIAIAIWSLWWRWRATHPMAKEGRG